MKDLNAMLTVVKEGRIADPFDVHEEKLIALDTREIMDPEIQRCLCTIEELERTLRDEAVRERLSWQPRKHIKTTVSKPKLKECVMRQQAGEHVFLLTPQFQKERNTKLF